MPAQKVREPDQELAEDREREREVGTRRQRKQ